MAKETTGITIDPRTAVAAANNRVWIAENFQPGSLEHDRAIKEYAELLANDPNALKAMQELHGWES